MRGEKKYRTILVFQLRFLVACALLFFVSGQGQEATLQKKIKDIQTLLTTVEANKLTYVQDLKTVSPGYYDYSVIEMDNKGNEKEALYSFALSDINTKSVKSFTKKDVILIEISVTAKQKMIKKSTDGGDKTTYLSSFFMYALNADNGRELEKAIKEAIPDAVELDKKSLSLNTYQEHLDWLKANISNVDLPKKQIGQLIGTDASKPGFIVFEQTEGSKENRMELNLSLLDPNSVKYKISGSEFLIEIATKKGVKGIKHFEGNDLKDFQNKILFYAGSAANGKNIYKVLKRIIPMAEVEFDKSKPDLGSVSKALKYINGHIADVASGGDIIEQHLDLKEGVAKIIRKETNGDKSDEYEYGFDLADINKSIISTNSKKDKLFLELSTNKGQSFINTIKNGELENYSKKFMLFFNALDEALICKEALQFLIQNRLDNMEKENSSPVSLNVAVTELQKNITMVERDKDRFDQHIELMKTEEPALKFTAVYTTPKKDMTTVSEFSIADINWKNIDIKVSGKRVWVAIRTKGSKKVIKTYEEGEVENYQKEMEIEALDIENARSIIKALKKIG